MMHARRRGRIVRVADAEDDSGAARASGNAKVRPPCGGRTLLRCGAGARRRQTVLTPCACGGSGLGGGSTVSSNDCTLSVPLLAVTSRLYVASVPASGVPAIVAVPSPLSWKLRPDGRAVAPIDRVVEVG